MFRTQVATNQIQLLPSYPHLYPKTPTGLRIKAERIASDMERIYAEAENCLRMEQLLKAGLKELRDKFFQHTEELQVGGCLTGVRDTPELRARLSGVNRTNTVVETVFALEKFLSTREKGSQLVNRKGWTMFKYNKTWVWGEKLGAGKLQVYGNVCRAEARRIRMEQGSVNAQLQRIFALKAEERQTKLNQVRERVAAREAQVARLQEPSLRCTTFSGLKLLAMPELIEQLKIRKIVDGRKESNGKALIVTPPARGGREWLVLKLQGLLVKEFEEKKLANNPNDLSPGDLGCDSRAPRKARVANNPGTHCHLIEHLPCTIAQ